MGDPIGKAILRFSKNQSNKNIVVQCDICEDDVIPVPYLLRTFEEMPDLEKFALLQAEGRVLDVGSGAGCHALYLKEKGFDVVALEQSEGACEYLREREIETAHTDIMSYSGEKFDTIFLLMNGLGLARSLDELPVFLNHLKSLLTDKGKILCDSSDISYLYENEDGSIWIDLNSNYYGEVKYNMSFENEETGWFDWLFVDQDNLTRVAENCGLKIEILFQGDNNHYLAELKL